MAQPFDPGAAHTAGEAVPVAEQVGITGNTKFPRQHSSWWPRTAYWPMLPVDFSVVEEVKCGNWRGWTARVSAWALSVNPA